MKSGITALVALSGLLVGTLANPLPDNSAQLVRRTTNVNEIFAQVESHTSAALAICAEAGVDIHADLDVRAAIAAKLQADLQAAAALLAEAAADIKASAEAEVISANSGCDASCIQDVVIEHSTTFCEDIDVVVETLGEDCVKEYVQPCMSEFGKFTTCLDGIFVGIGAKVGAIVKGVLGASLSLSLGLDLDLILGLGGILGIGRV